jgi:hypothetical protein
MIEKYVSAGIVAVSLTLPACVVAQNSPCDRLRPLPDSDAQYKERGNRCEGLYVADVGVPSLELVSFQLGGIAYQLYGGEHLRVTAPGQKQSVHVRAVAVPARTYYRMDATIEAGATLDWPVSDVLLPQNLGPERIGVFAWKGSENAMIFVPVRIQGGGAAAANQKAVAILTMRPSFDVARIMWRSAVVAGERCSTFGDWQNLATSQVLAQQPVRLKLGSLTGQHCVEVAAQAGSSNDWSTVQVRVELPTQ